MLLFEIVRQTGELHRWRRETFVALRDRGESLLRAIGQLEPGEPLRPWPVAGTTGYEFIAAMASLFVDPDGLAQLSRAYGTIANDDVTKDGQRFVMVEDDSGIGRLRVILNWRADSEPAAGSGLPR